MSKGVMIAASSWLSLLGVIGALASSCAPAPALAQQFSADLVRTAGAGAAASFGRLRVFNDKVRIETPDFPGGFFLTDGANRTAYFARPGQRVFMDARQSSRLTQLFVPVDPSAPCPQWQDMAKLADATGPSETWRNEPWRNEAWRCERVGEELVGGRGVVGFRAMSSPGGDILGWIDPNLKFPLRIRMQDGTTIALENIHEEPQPEHLFEIPPGFQKFDPQALIKRIKQSDVWVDAPPP